MDFGRAGRGEDSGHTRQSGNSREARACTGNSRGGRAEWEGRLNRRSSLGGPEEAG